MDQRAGNQPWKYAIYSIDLNGSCADTVGVSSICVANKTALLVLTRVGFLLVFKLKSIILHEFKKIYSLEKWGHSSEAVEDFKPEFILQIDGIPYSALPNPFKPDYVAILSDLKATIISVSPTSFRPTKLIEMPNEREKKLYHFQWISRSSFAVSLASQSKIFELKIKKDEDEGLFTCGFKLEQIRSITLSFTTPFKFISVPPSFLCTFDTQIYGAHISSLTKTIHSFFSQFTHSPQTLELVQTVFSVSADRKLMCLTDFFSTEASHQQSLIHQTPLIIIPAQVKEIERYESNWIKFLWEGVVRELVFSPFTYSEDVYLVGMLTQMSMVVIEIRWEEKRERMKVLMEVRNSFVFGDGYGLHWLDPFLLAFLNHNRELVCFRLIQY